MDKKNLYIDYDGCIVNTIKAVCEMYDEDYWTENDYKRVDWSEIETWDFEELSLISKEEINNYFNEERFFNRVDFMPWADFILRKLSSYYNITIVSMGNSENLRLKEIWCKKHFPYFKFIGVCLNNYSNKAHIDMSDGIFIDDTSANLNTCNANKRICFGDKYSWNEDWDGIRCANWFDIWKEIGEPIRRKVNNIISMEEYKFMKGVIL